MHKWTLFLDLPLVVVVVFAGFGCCLIIYLHIWLHSLMSLTLWQVLQVCITNTGIVCLVYNKNNKRWLSAELVFKLFILRSYLLYIFFCFCLCELYFSFIIFCFTSLINYCFLSVCIINSAYKGIGIYWYIIFASQTSTPRTPKRNDIVVKKISVLYFELWLLTIYLFDQLI